MLCMSYYYSVSLGYMDHQLLQVLPVVASLSILNVYYCFSCKAPEGLSLHNPFPKSQLSNAARDLTAFSTLLPTGYRGPTPELICRIQQKEVEIWVWSDEDPGESSWSEDLSPGKSCQSTHCPYLPLRTSQYPVGGGNLQI